MEDVFETLANILKPEPMKNFELKEEQFTVNLGGKKHKVEVFYFEQYGQAYEIEGVTVDGKDVTDEIFVIEELLNFSVMNLIENHINNQ